jgi:hypothetical protein
VIGAGGKENVEVAPLDIRDMLPGEAPPLHFGVSYTASKLCGRIHALLEQIIWSGFAPQLLRLAARRAT